MSYGTNSNNSGGANNTKVKQAQAATDEVVGIMHQNIQKVIDRGDKLDDLQDKTEVLQGQASQFQKGATKLKKQMWWKNMKLNLLIAAICAAIIFIIVMAACFSGGTNHCATSSNSGSGDNSNNNTRSVHARDVEVNTVHKVTLVSDFLSADKTVSANAERRTTKGVGAKAPSAWRHAKVAKE